VKWHYLFSSSAKGGSGAKVWIRLVLVQREEKITLNPAGYKYSDIINVGREVAIQVRPGSLLSDDDSEAMFAPQPSAADSKDVVPRAPVCFAYIHVIIVSRVMVCGV
jgi:hypothetical protein